MINLNPSVVSLDAKRPHIYTILTKITPFSPLPTHHQIKPFERRKKMGGWKKNCGKSGLVGMTTIFRKEHSL